MCPIVGGRTAQELFEQFVKIAYVIKTDREGDIGDGHRFLDLFDHFLGRFKNAVSHQIFKRCHLQSPGKTAAAFALADMDAVCDLF